MNIIPTNKILILQILKNKSTKIYSLFKFELVAVHKEILTSWIKCF